MSTSPEKTMAERELRAWQESVSDWEHREYFSLF